MAHDNFYASQWDYDSYHSFLIERFTLRSLFLMQHAFNDWFIYLYARNQFSNVISRA